MTAGVDRMCLAYLHPNQTCPLTERWLSNTYLTQIPKIPDCLVNNRTIRRQTLIRLTRVSLYDKLWTTNEVILATKANESVSIG